MLKKKFLVLFFIITFNVDCFAKNNIFILVAIDDQILTNFDVKKEAEYLETLNPNLKQLNKDNCSKHIFICNIHTPSYSCT